MKHGYLLLVWIAVSSCEKGINFKLDTSQPSLVVEATIENGTAPMVVLSNSFDYF